MGKSWADKRSISLAVAVTILQLKLHNCIATKCMFAATNTIQLQLNNLFTVKSMLVAASTDSPLQTCTCSDSFTFAAAETGSSFAATYACTYTTNQIIMIS